MRRLAWLWVVAGLAACQPPGVSDDYDPVRDYFTHANTADFVTQHLVLDLDVDFAQRRLSGSALLYLRRLDPAARQVVLDSDGLEVERVRLEGGSGEPIELTFALGATDPVVGEALAIDLPAPGLVGEVFQLRIDYRTGAEATAIMWLAPELTAGGQYPFMFTQSQSIHARSWVPLQDTPAVRITYQATIRTPPELLALMSANNDPQAPRDGEYQFSMPQPIPSYLLALAVGHVFFAPLGDQTGVYAEPEVLPAAAWEFADTQSMMDSAESMYGPYEWGRYDLLILPPSFPYGGMENPRLSFITPSVLAGDRSLVSLIAHELAHSWSGNLVSNATWRDIWLNEGVTSYLEARLMEVLFGRERADEERLLSYQSLQQQLAITPPAMQALAPRLDGGDPGAQDGLEYSKGQLLLETLEARFGRELFDRFMAGYFRQFAFRAITSEHFLDYLDVNLLQAHAGRYSRAEVEQWLYQPGIPPGASVPQSDRLEHAAAAASAWATGERDLSDVSFGQWSPHGMVAFIQALPEALEVAQLESLDAALGLSQSGNVEIARSWFIEVARRQLRSAYPAMNAYLARFGRTRLIEPVYQALVENGSDAGLARQQFDVNRSHYHPLTAAAIQSLFETPAKPRTQ